MAAAFRATKTLKALGTDELSSMLRHIGPRQATVTELWSGLCHLAKVLCLVWTPLFTMSARYTYTATALTTQLTSSSAQQTVYTISVRSIGTVEKK